MQATQAAQVEPAFPPLHGIDYNPEVWSYQKQVGNMEVVAEGICEYLGRVLMYILTFSFCCCEEFPWRKYQVSHEIVETFICRDRSRATLDDIRYILAYLYTPYAPLNLGTEVVRDTTAIYNSLEGSGRLTIIGRRTTANFRETSRLAITYNVGQSQALPVLSREVMPLVSSYRPYWSVRSEFYAPMMRPGAAFVLQQDHLGGANSSSFITGQQLQAALQWLGVTAERADAAREAFNYMVSASLFNNILHNNCIYSLRGIPNVISFVHSGYWIVSLHEENGRKSIKFILQQPGGSVFRDNEANLLEQLQQRRVTIPRRQDLNNCVHIEPFVSPAEGQIGYEVTVRG